MPDVNMHPVINLAAIDRTLVAEGFYRARGFGGAFTDAIGHVVRVVHSTRHYSRVELNEVEVYLGRSTLDNVVRRFSQRRAVRGHSHGVILFRTKGAYVKQLERVGLLILSELRELNAFCVANIDTAGSGPEPQPSNEACVYMTWGRCKPRELRVPLKRELTQVARNVAARARDIVSSSTVLTGLSKVHSSVFYNHLE